MGHTQLTSVFPWGIDLGLQDLTQETKVIRDNFEDLTENFVMRLDCMDLTFVFFTWNLSILVVQLGQDLLVLGQGQFGNLNIVLNLPSTGPDLLDLLYLLINAFSII